MKFTIHPEKKESITPSPNAPLSHHHANYVAVSRITFCKKGQSHHRAMLHFHAITEIILLFHESHLEKMTNHTIKPTAGGGSIKSFQSENCHLS